MFRLLFWLWTDDAAAPPPVTSTNVHVHDLRARGRHRIIPT